MDDTLSKHLFIDHQQSQRNHFSLTSSDLGGGGMIGKRITMKSSEDDDYSDTEDKDEVDKDEEEPMVNNKGLNIFLFID